MSAPYARMRVRRDQAEMLISILYSERNRLIAEKIEMREAGHDPAPLRRDLIAIQHLIEEAKRAKEDLDVDQP